jgi:peptidylprolyl isomerase
MLTTLIAGLMLGDYPARFTPDGAKVEFTLEKGSSFTMQMAPKLAPKTVARIIDLVKQGFYDQQRFHRVEYWVTQWGAPASKTKPLTDNAVLDGGSGVSLPFEGCDRDFVRGVVGVASEGLQLGGDSQLFILKGDRLYLYGSYAIIGMVTRGMDVVDGIKKGDRIRSVRVKTPR